MNSRQRNYLRSLATKIKPIVTIGKSGISDSVIQEVREVLEGKELIKITILKNSLLEPREVLSELVDALKAEPVQFIGYKIVLYKKSSRDDIEHIKLPQ